MPPRPMSLVEPRRPDNGSSPTGEVLAVAVRDAAMLIELDEIVDAANGLAELAGLETVDAENGRRDGDGVAGGS